LDEAVESLAFAIIEVLIGSGIFLLFILKYIRGFCQEGADQGSFGCASSSSPPR
jgi:hypothetical protein